MSTDREKRLAEKETRTKGISELIRFVSFGLVALTYSIFTSSAQFAIDLLANYRDVLLWASVCGAAAIASDYLQYLCGYIAVNKALLEEDQKYSSCWFSYRLIKPFFVLKQALAVFGVILVCLAMIKMTFI